MKKISFDIVRGDNADVVLQRVTAKCPDCDFEYIGEILGELSELDDGCEYAVSVCDGCLLIRVYDEEYYFLYPEPVCEVYDVFGAIESVRLYTVREEIPLVISEIPRDEADSVADLFSNSEIYDDGDMLCTVRAQSEIMLLEELPSVSGERISLIPLCDDDKAEYARLCTDADTNLYWGYDCFEDNPDPDDSYFVQSAIGELSRGIAASYSVRFNGEFIGEALFYAFDLRGSAECALRLLPKYRGRGLSRECIELICESAARIGLKQLYATVDDRNTPSIKLFEKTFDIIEQKDGITRFLRNM